MTNTYIALSTITLATATSSVTFGSIPPTYRDLVLVANYGATSANTSLSSLQFNSDTGANYNDVFMSGNNDNTTSSGSSSAQTSLRVLRNFFDASALNQQAQIQFMDYSATDKHKSILIRVGSTTVGGGGGGVVATAGRWASTSAITTIRFFTGNTFLVGSTLSLYGIGS